jgi:excisionase family DNA binding protein
MIGTVERPNPGNNKLLHRVKETKVMLGVGNTTVFNLIKAGKLEARKLGGLTMITDESLRRFVENLPPTKNQAGA